MKKYFFKVVLVFCMMSLTGQGLAWHEKTHLAVAKVVGYKAWYNAAGADIAKIKAGNVESFNHWYNNNNETEITSKNVLDQVERYNKVNEAAGAEGHLYGAIVAALQCYEKDSASGKYSEYHIAYAAHYIGDLSNPLHNIPRDEFSIAHHSANDSVVENTVLDQTDKIAGRMYTIVLSDDHFEADLAREIARIANLSRQLGYKLRAEKGI